MQQASKRGPEALEQVRDGRPGRPPGALHGPRIDDRRLDRASGRPCAITMAPGRSAKIEGSGSDARQPAHVPPPPAAARPRRRRRRCRRPASCPRARPAVPLPHAGPPRRQEVQDEQQRWCVWEQRGLPSGCRRAPSAGGVGWRRLARTRRRVAAVGAHAASGGGGWRARGVGWRRAPRSGMPLRPPLGMLVCRAWARWCHAALPCRWPAMARGCCPRRRRRASLPPLLPPCPGRCAPAAAANGAPAVEIDEDLHSRQVTALFSSLICSPGLGKLHV